MSFKPTQALTTVTNAMSPYTVLPHEDGLLVDTVGGPVTILLPSAAVSINRKLAIYRTSFLNAAITVTPDGAETIQRVAGSHVLEGTSQFVDEHLVLISNGVTDWRIEGVPVDLAVVTTHIGPITGGAVAGGGQPVLRLGASPSEGLETRVIREVVTTGAINNDMGSDLVAGVVIIGVQSNVDTALTGGGTTTNYAIGTVADPDKYVDAVGVLTLGAKTNHMPAPAVLAGVEDIRVNAVTAAGAVGDTALTVGTVRVVIYYQALNALDNA